ncbi:hypothetical protein RhiirC2_797787 [Rhizophagus irregularis]|uniref:RRM domain-containing protein n=1 Tax=Rhizophagus irregularis TaxID=588596 RepID=A0A2N1M7G3_9GLOM|nr:hypothetical protein RhiirC2_797787 [Rhizophagus irregularis]
MCDEVDCSLSRYPSYGAHARCDGSGDNKKILVFFNDQHDFTDCISFPRADLLDLAFTHYSPADAKLNDEAKSFRREHVAILAGIPKNIKDANLLEIATQVNAEALNIPLSINSYKPKPYAYLNFSSFDTLEAAKEMTVAFHGKGLMWHPPNEAHTLCHVCGRPGCSPSICNPRPTQKVDDRLDKLYSCFNAGSRHGHQDSHQSHLYPPHDDQETHSYDNGWDDISAHDTNSGFNFPPHTSPSLMDTSPDASFSALDPNSVLSRRHVPLPNSRPTIIAPDANASRLQLEISNVTNTQKNLSAQLGSIMNKLDSFFPSKPSPSND